MKKKLLFCMASASVGLVLACTGTIAATPAAVAVRNDMPRLRVLIITPDPAVGYGNGIASLLSKSGLEAEVVRWEQATNAFAEDFDVLVVTGQGRFAQRTKVYLGYQKPVVAYGPYGCRYLGMLQLKNGHPYT
ncbi:MAG: hypothetical protein ACYSWQ_05085 [Planctomycetota bacterium]|jgi:hypothetical protein